MTDFGQSLQLLPCQVEVEGKAYLVELGDRDCTSLEDITLDERSVDILPLIADLLFEVRVELDCSLCVHLVDSK